MTDAAPAAAVAIAKGYSFTYGGQAPRFHARRPGPMTVFTENCFLGLLTATDGQPRAVAPLPYVDGVHARLRALASAGDEP